MSGNDSQSEGDDGYSLPVYGLSDGTFYHIHIPALTCIVLSFISAISIMAYSFFHQNIRTFFTWSKSERFVVYMALCDALFNMAHFSDHLHIVLTKHFPLPKPLCAFYGFMLAEFISAQNLMVNIVAINVFMIVYFRRKLYFGRWDYRLLLYIFGLPGTGAAIAWAFGTLGPNGTFCYFDGVKGSTASLFFTTVPLLHILISNSVLYVISWVRIHKEAHRIKKTLGKNTQTMMISHRSANTMSLFVVAFFIQWWAMAMYGVWQLVDEIPQLLFNFVTTFSNVGGILNGIVFIIIVRRKRQDASSNRYRENSVGMTRAEASPTND